ncbi:MAG: DUF3466 family protein [Armatimonadetes bacterium]|nr:DUF3466 family protein [Armatimonadota bacterium]
MRVDRTGVILSLVLIILVSGAEAKRYRLRDLGGLGTGSGFAYDINDLGQVVGSTGLGAYSSKPFLWSRETGMINLVDLPNPQMAGAGATRINAVGEAVGYLQDADYTSRAFFWSRDTGMIDLGTLARNNSSHATGINDLGQVVGVSYTSYWDPSGFGILFGMSPFVWTKDTGLRRLSMPHSYGFYPQWVTAADINNSGQVVGMREVESGFRAYVWSEEEGDLTLEFRSASAINESGEVVGYDTADYQNYSAVAWNPITGTRYLEPLQTGESSQAHDINDLGQIVGMSAKSIYGDYRAVLWDTDGRVIALPGLPNGYSSEAYSINNNGEIVGYANRMEDGRLVSHPVLWESSVVTTVSIDIKPGSEKNVINLRSHGVVAVAVLSNTDFNALAIDPALLSLAGAPVRIGSNSGKPQVHCQDINSDGKPDLVAHFNTEDLQLTVGDQSATLEGETFTSTMIEGIDYIHIVP